MILLLIILVAVCQLGMYLITEEAVFKYRRGVILLGVLLAHLFVFPQYFFPKFEPGEVNCGMPALAITLMFLICGGGSAVVVHVGYYFFRKAKGNSTSNLECSEILDAEFHDH